MNQDIFVSLLLSREKKETIKNEPEAQTGFVADSSNLASRISRITAERGSFIHLTENGLRQEIEQKKHSQDKDPLSSDTITNEEDNKNKNNNNNENNNNENNNNENKNIKNENDTDETINNTITDSLSEKDNKDTVDEEENPLLDEKTKEALKNNKAFIKARQILSDKVAVARNEAALALDYISLLISSARPSAGATSMSPMLKERVPIGSLGAHKSFESTDILANSDNSNICRGWKIQSLNDAVSTLKKADNKLSTSIAHEKIYWDEMYKIASAGGKLRRMWPVGSSQFSQIHSTVNSSNTSSIAAQEDRSFAIDYGYGLSSSSRFSGVAPISFDKQNGSVHLKKKIAIDRYIAISVYRDKNQQNTNNDTSKQFPFNSELDSDINFKKTAEYLNNRYLDFKENSNDILLEIKNAQDSLFEEELFNDLLIEAKSLQSLGVKFTSNEIRFKIAKDIIISIFMKEAKSTSNDNNENDDRKENVKIKNNNESETKNSDLKLAQVISSLLHLFLSNRHKRIFNKINQPTSVHNLARSLNLSSSQSSSSTNNLSSLSSNSSILSPLISQINHYNWMTKIISIFEDHFATLNKAGIKIKLNKEKYTNLKEWISKAKENPRFFDKMFLDFPTAPMSTISLEIDETFLISIIVRSELQSSSLFTAELFEIQSDQNKSSFISDSSHPALFFSSLPKKNEKTNAESNLKAVSDFSDLLEVKFWIEYVIILYVKTKAMDFGYSLFGRGISDSSGKLCISIGFSETDDGLILFLNDKKSTVSWGTEPTSIWDTLKLKIK